MREWSRDACAYVVSQLAKSASVWTERTQRGRKKQEVDRKKMNEKRKRCTKIKEERVQVVSGLKSKAANNDRKLPLTLHEKKKPAGCTCWKTRKMQKLDWSVDLEAEQIRQGVVEMIKKSGHMSWETQWGRRDRRLKTHKFEKTQKKYYGEDESR